MLHIPDASLRPPPPLFFLCFHRWRFFFDIFSPWIFWLYGKTFRHNKVQSLAAGANALAAAWKSDKRRVLPKKLRCLSTVFRKPAAPIALCRRRLKAAPDHVRLCSTGCVTRDVSRLNAGWRTGTIRLPAEQTRRDRKIYHREDRSQYSLCGRKARGELLLLVAWNRRDKRHASPKMAARLVANLTPSAG